MPSLWALTWPNSDFQRVRRRDLFIKSGLLLTALSITPSKAWSLGGVVLEQGTEAPSFDLPGSSRREPDRDRWSSDDLRGRWLAVYFYPRDFTGGCTIEARGFESLHSDFLAAGAEVVGISADSVDDHASFCESEGLSFPLLSDPDGTVSKAYGVLDGAILAATHFSDRSKRDSSSTMGRGETEWTCPGGTRRDHGSSKQHLCLTETVQS